MAPTSKEAQRAELHKTIWQVANDLRGSVDGWDFKSYVLGMLFYRFISENLTTYINKGEHEAGETDFDFAKLPDADAEFARAEIVQEKGLIMEQENRRARNGAAMKRISYKPLWKNLVDKGWLKRDLQQKAAIRTGTVAKLGRNEIVTTALLVKIAEALNCEMIDIAEIVEDTQEESYVEATA